jgi:phosphatidylserine decarboxylase
LATSQYPVIAREGWLPLALCAALAILTTHYAGIAWAIPMWMAFSVLLLAFRDPRREIPPSPLAIVSPADGRVVSVEKVHDPYLDRMAVQIGIQMNRYGVFSTRSPIEGKALEPPENNHESRANHGEMPHGVWLKSDEGDDLVMVMNRGPLHTSPRCYVQFGERVGQGQRCGFIHLGGRVDVYLPERSRINVTPGSIVTGGSDIIANLIH